MCGIFSGLCDILTGMWKIISAIISAVLLIVIIYLCFFFRPHYQDNCLWWQSNCCTTVSRSELGPRCWGKCFVNDFTKDKPREACLARFYDHKKHCRELSCKKTEHFLENKVKQGVKESEKIIGDIAHKADEVFHKLTGR